jgi:hypothetical protein
VSSITGVSSWAGGSPAVVLVRWPAVRTAG